MSGAIVEPLLFLCHRIPYPPQKGDKVRSYHLLRHLARHYDVHLGTFVDDPEDWQHERALTDLCAQVCLRPLDPRAARIRSLDGLRTGQALSVGYYRDAALQTWVDDVLESEGIEKALVFSSPMASYVRGKRGLHVVVDFVDVDSAKWREYSSSRKWPLSWLYRREADRLLAFERAVAAEAMASVFVTRAEAEFFERLAPETRGCVHAITNGVDHTYFQPNEHRPSPYAGDEEPIVFTGAMDYWPNINAVVWFARKVLPMVVAARPRAKFWIVGMNPASDVLALRSRSVMVTGRVADVRPYIQHARVVVAPLRIARGVQNKVLEAMALGKAVVASPACATPIKAREQRVIEIADTADAFADKIVRLLANAHEQERIGSAARSFVSAMFDWDVNLAAFRQLLAQPNEDRLNSFASPRIDGEKGTIDVSA